MSINKSMRVFEAFLKKSLELELRDRSGFMIAAFMLIPLEADNAIEKKR